MKDANVVRCGRAVLGLALACALAPAAWAQDAAAAARVNVEVGDFSQMRELKHLSGMQRRDTEQSIQALAKWLQHQAARRLPAGETLQVTLRDVDLAGDYEPGRTDGYDIRVVKDLYPPRIELEYRLDDADGKPLRQGEATLRDTGFLFGIGPMGSDPLRFEKRMLDDWLRGQFATAAPAD